MSRTLLALAPLFALGCTTLAGGDHLDDSLRGDPRIVGGQQAPDDLFPHQVSLQTRWGDHYCGGSVIDSEWVLTAAHCVDGSRANDIKVEAGITFLSDQGERVDVAEIVVHPGYDAWTQDNDMALLRLASPLSVAPVALLDASAEADLAGPGAMATVSGWGTLRSGGASPDALQYVDVPVVDQDDCEAAYGAGAITDGMICAGYLDVGGADSCQGDSGGPLVVDDGTGWVQAGVVSWGYGCADARYPGVYARVSAYRGFVEDHVPGAVFVDGTGGTGGTTEPTEPGTEPLPIEGEFVLAPVGGVRDDVSIPAFLGAGDAQIYVVQIDGDPNDVFTFGTRTTGSTDTFGSLYDADGNYITHDDDSGADYNFQFRADLSPGTYLLLVEGYDATVSGSYTLQAMAK